MNVFTTKSIVKNTSSGAVESLTAESSQEDFILELSNAIASFIRTNREAFDDDDSTAVQEFVDVLSVEDVVNKILESLQTPVEPDEESFVEPEVEAEAADGEVQSQGDGDLEMVSDDVMALLDED